MLIPYRLRLTPLNALEPIWWWNLIVDQAVASSILVKGALLTEDIRLDEETVLKTAGADTASGFESLVFRLASCKR